MFICFTGWQSNSGWSGSHPVQLPTQSTVSWEVRWGYLGLYSSVPWKSSGRMSNISGQSVPLLDCPHGEKGVLTCQVLQPPDYLGSPLLNSLQFINLSWGLNRTNAKWRHVITSFNCLATVLLNSSRCGCLFLLPGYIAGSCLTSYLLRIPPASFQLSCSIAGQSLPCNAARVYYYPRCETSHLSLMKLPSELLWDLLTALDHIDWFSSLWCQLDGNLMTVLFTDEVLWFLFFTATVVFFLVARSHAELNLKCFFIALAVECNELINTRQRLPKSCSMEGTSRGHLV